jgi:predicted ATPase
VLVQFQVEPVQQVLGERRQQDRDHPFSHAVRVYDTLVAWYEACGYQVAPRPKVPVAERCRIVLSLLPVAP